MRPEIATKFFHHTDETGRFVVTSERTGRTYAIEAIVANRAHKNRKWGSVDPATKELTHKKGDDKYTGAIEEAESLITEENGFTNIQTLDKGVSPLDAVRVLDSKYPDK